MTIPTARVVVVTGGGQGIGMAIVHLHRARGWRVVAVERHAGHAAALVEAAPDVTVVTGDVAAAGVLESALDRARDLGVLAAWVSNAASVEGRALDLIDDAHVEQMLAVNIAAVVRGTRLAVSEFRSAGTQGSIVAISSVHARLGFGGHALYDTSKGAVEAMCRAVAAEAGPFGVRCNAVAPGAVMTERETEARAATTPVTEPIPRAMFITPEEIAEVVAFLTSPASAAINGAVIAADRGLSTTFLDEHWHAAQPRG